jgi:gamma-glutamyltranspeptidase / glutathione hydrolase / leukotriene-C4 hydrolase
LENIGTKKAHNFPTIPLFYYKISIFSQKEDHGTSHVSVLDPEGNGVSATSTVNRWLILTIIIHFKPIPCRFGAVVQSEQLGIVWNDEMDDFSTPGMANGFGFAPSESNYIEPGKRPMSSMSPMVIYDLDTGKVCGLFIYGNLNIFHKVNKFSMQPNF